MSAELSIAPALLSLLRCPVCKQELALRSDSFACAPCSKRYPVVMGIPDFRLYEDPLIPLADDYRKAEKLQAQAEKLSFAELVRYYWSLPTYPPTPDDRKEHFVHHVLTDEQRIATYIDRIGSGSAFLDVGCGTAALAKVAQGRFNLSVACDVAFRWLIVARKRLQEAGLPANLVCCCADYLPFAAGSFDCVAAVSLLEHVPDALSVTAECGRVLKNTGRLFILTTNRFSLAPEPHVGLWGVGFLPRKWMPAYVKWRRGLAYEKKHLLSCFELRDLLRRAGFRTLRFWLPRITAADLENRSSWERAGAHMFRFVSRLPLLGRLLLLLSPVIQVLATGKEAAVSAAPPAGQPSSQQPSDQMVAGNA